MRRLLLSLVALVPALVRAEAACVAGRAQGYECERVDLVAHLDAAALGYGDLNDIWGWTDPATGVEYALIGAVGGTIFVDLSTPTAPRIVGRLRSHDEIVGPIARCKAGPGLATVARQHDEVEDGICGAGGSAWRDLKVHADHVFIVSEAAGHGMQVFDLRQLRNFPAGSAVQEFAETTHYPGFGNAHNLAIDGSTGFAFAIGSDTFSGGPHIVDVRVPGLPLAAGGYAADGYTHDAHCVVYAGPDTRYTGREVCLLANEDTLTIIDVTDKSAIVQVARATYGQVAYTHQVWFTADHRHAYANDELDETSSNLRTRTLVWDLTDLRAPVLAHQYLHPAATIDHNNYVHAGHVFQSNYTAGLVVLDAQDPLQPFEVGFFDTAPADDLRRFAGTWSNYPFFASGLVAVSDIEGGLFVLRPRLPAATGTDLRLTLSRAAARDLRVTVTNAGSLAATAPTIVVAADPDLALEQVSAAGVACEPSLDAQVTGQAAWRCRVSSLAPGARFDLDVRVGSGAGRVDAMVASDAREMAPGDNRAALDVALGEDDDGSTGGEGGGGAPGLASLGILSLLVRRRLRMEPTAQPPV